MHDSVLTRDEPEPTTPETSALKTPQPPTLKDAATRAVRKCIGFSGIVEAATKLPLPLALIEYIQKLNIKNFVILSGEWEVEHYNTNLMPAVYEPDGTKVMLRICDKVSPSVNDPAYLMKFDHREDYTVYVFAPTRNLGERIEEWREKEERCPETIIWKVAEVMARTCAELSPEAKFTATSVHFLNDDIFLRAHTHSVSMPLFGRSRGCGRLLTRGFYNPPEVTDYRLRTPPNEKMQSWMIGAIAYEMAALEPAFYNRSGTNLFQVSYSIAHGLPPPPIKNVIVYTDNLQSFIRDCMCHLASRRPTLAEIETTAHENYVRLSGEITSGD